MSNSAGLPGCEIHYCSVLQKQLFSPQEGCPAYPLMAFARVERMTELFLPCNDRRSKSRRVRALAHSPGHEFNHSRKPPPPEPSPHPSPNLHLRRSHPHQGPTMSASFPQTNHSPLAKVTFTHPRTFPPSTLCRCPFSFKSACATFLTCPPTHSGPSEGVQMMPCRKALRKLHPTISYPVANQVSSVSNHVS